MEIGGKIFDKKFPRGGFYVKTYQFLSDGARSISRLKRMVLESGFLLTPDPEGIR